MKQTTITGWGASRRALSLLLSLVLLISALNVMNPGSALASAHQYGDYEYTDNGTYITITRYTGTDAFVVIPGAISGKPVVTIGQNAFYRCTNLTSVIIPSSVTELQHEAFRDCANLEYVYIESFTPPYPVGTSGSPFSGVKTGAKVYPQERPLLRTLAF